MRRKQDGSAVPGFTDNMALQALAQQRFIAMPQPDPVTPALGKANKHKARHPAMPFW
jgi:hypothetical protein